MDLKAQFEQAVTDSKTLSEKPSNDILLQLYALYKQGSVGDNNTEPPSNPFDFVAKAKHEAWDALKGKTQESAMQDYVALVKELQQSQH
ncbi:acyl-CoA-binding protein [Chitinophaga flava]|uniref:Acyl-CoA-binding protein n=1 Tax=Chitinophaga flava TaxID=2259036 RepID=A0A365XW59_9BACT|nr:acyl-CoA-binding protein [Chitinophaga flava]RBL90596.1 acyl-CoA-binding protein [Chitinophaga flava]